MLIYIYTRTYRIILRPEYVDSRYEHREIKTDDLSVKKNAYPYMGGFNAYSLFGYLIQYPTPSRAGPINVEYFQKHHPSRSNQPTTFTSDSIRTLVTP